MSFLWKFVVCLMIYVAIMGAVIGGTAVSKAIAKTVEATTNDVHLEGVYLLDGYNVKSFVDADDGLGSGAPVFDGHSWDSIVIANPKIVGEKVYPEKSYFDDDKEHWFYQDQLTKATTPVFAINRGARSYTEDELTMEPKEDQLDWSKEGIWDLERTFLINPDSEPNGKVRIYISDHLLPEALKDGKKHFFYRQNLRLLNPEVLR